MDNTPQMQNPDEFTHTTNTHPHAPAATSGAATFLFAAAEPRALGGLALTLVPSTVLGGGLPGWDLVSNAVSAEPDNCDDASRSPMIVIRSPMSMSRVFTSTGVVKLGHATVLPLYTVKTDGAVTH